MGETGRHMLLQSTPREAAGRCLEGGGDAWEDGAGYGEPGGAKWISEPGTMRFSGPECRDQGWALRMGEIDQEAPWKIPVRLHVTRKLGP